MPSITVRHILRDDLTLKVQDREYWLCLNPECNVVYFDERGSLFNQTDVKVPIWYKAGASPRYACYCNKVTQEEIVDAIKNRGAKDLAAIAQITGAMTGGHCLTRNPSGRCCHAEVKRILAETIRSLDHVQ